MIQSATRDLEILNLATCSLTNCSNLAAWKLFANYTRGVPVYRRPPQPVPRRSYILPVRPLANYPHSHKRHSVSTMQNPQPLAGLLHVYDVEHRLTCFESTRSASVPNSSSSAVNPPNCVIFVGGLGDGLAAIPVLPELSNALHQNGEWSLIQVLTRSSYLGWTTGGIDRDVEDLITLERYLRTKAAKSGKLVLLGHSTGCQDIVRLFQLHGTTTSYNASILQAPVSDREYAADSTPAADFTKTIQSAEEQSRAGGGAFPMPWQALDIINEDQQYKDPISADRWISLVTKGGHEDFFSSDLDDAALRDIFAGLRECGKPVLFLMSGKDECIPKHINLQELTKRFISATSGDRGRVEGKILDNAGHSVESEEMRSEMVRIVLDFVNRLT